MQSAGNALRCHVSPVCEALQKVLPPAQKFSSGYRRLGQAACTSSVADKSTRSRRTHWTQFCIWNQSSKATKLARKKGGYTHTNLVRTYPNNELASSANTGRGCNYLSPLKAGCRGSTCLKSRKVRCCTNSRHVSGCRLTPVDQFSTP